MSKINQLLKELEERKVAKQAELEELKQTIALNHELTKLESPLYNKRALSAQDSLTLDVLINQVEEQYSRDDRKLSLTFGYGIIPNKILTLLKAILFSKAADKEELLMLTGLDEQIVEDTLDAFGNTAYFSKHSVEIVPAQEMNINRVKELLELVAIDMKLVSELDLSKFNTANIDYQYTRAQVKAEEMLDNTKQYIEVAQSYEE